MITSAEPCIDAAFGPGPLPPTILGEVPTYTLFTIATEPLLACLSMHMNHLQAVQAICEGPAALPGFRLTIAEISLAINGLDRYFAPLFAIRQVSLSEIRETLQWVGERFSGDALLEDVIQLLWAPLLEAQYNARRAAKGGGRHEH